MIVTVHGTHGSGKSTVIRKVMERFSNREELQRYPRRRPIGYLLSNHHANLFIPGHYETPCGGCDTIPVVNDVYGLIRIYARNGCNVLFEGILAQHSTPNLLSLKEWKPVVIVLDVSNDEAYAAVQGRRRERGDERPLKPDNIIKENASIKKRIPKLKDAGYDVRIVKRDAAYDEVINLLKV